jgi:hypothetical protein
MTVIDSLQMVEFTMLLICTTVHRAHGRRPSLVRRAVNLQPHLLGTWQSSRGVNEVFRVLRCCC